MGRWDKKEEPKQEVKPEVKDEPKAEETQSAQPLVLTSNIDAYVHEKLREQPKSLDDIEVKEVDLPEGKHSLSLPDEVDKKYSSRFAFRWINKDKRMIDRATTVRGWHIANRTYFPDLSRSLFTAIGTIERGDSILGFMPLKQATKLRQRPGLESLERVRNLPIEKWKEGGESYYKPKLTGEDAREEAQTTE
jgi:hypothetical protein